MAARGRRRSQALLCAFVAFVFAARSLYGAPNVLLIVTDDQRPDTISPALTPHLDRLAASGTRFERAIAAYPICHVSRAELLTGCSAFRALPQYPVGAIDSQLATWAGTFRAAGWHTWFVGKWHNDGQPKTRGYEETGGLFTAGGAGPAAKKEPQLDAGGRAITGYRGWTFKTDDGRPEPEKGVGLTPDISARFADAAIEFIERKTERPFFLQVSFTAPHDPRLMPTGYEGRYDPAKMPLPRNFAPQHPFDHGNLDGRDEQLLAGPLDPAQVREELATYCAILTHMDAQIGRLLDALDRSGQRERTIIIFTTDQGLALGSHGLLGKQNMYEHTVGVPLILAGPGIPRGERRVTQCYLRDLFPTACELTGIAVPKSVRGASLVPALRDPAHRVHPFVVGYFADTQRMLREERWKWIEYPKAGRTQLFDLQNDPDELSNLADDPAHTDRIGGMREKLADFLARTRE
jgi:arylsulfatase A-like enzyme